MTSRNGVKLNWASVPLSLAPEMIILETVPVESQTMPFHLQSLVRLVEDHELRKEEGRRLFFHWIRAPACVAGDAMVFSESGEQENVKEKKRRL